MSSIRVLLVEDDATLNKVLSQELAQAGFVLRSLLTAEGVMEAVREFQPQVALLDLKLPGVSGLDLLQQLRAEYADLQVVMLTGHGGIPEAVEAIQLGASDFLTKPTRLEVLEKTLRNAAEKADLLLENQRLRRAVAAAGDGHRILGSSEPIRELNRLIGRIGPADEGVLISGENGTGKELIARNLHALSRRHDKPMVTLNCGAVPENLVESELFGHLRGAFTGADRKKMGLFEAAHGGTLFLDEVGELPTSVQPALLRAIQFGEIRPVGATDTKTVDVRVLAATNRDLHKAIAAGEFRQDLFYRLATFQIEAPPLRDRPEDVAELARAFLHSAAVKAGRELEFDDSALARLAAHPWPGNARELQNAVTRLSVLAPAEIITASDIESFAFGSAGTPPSAPLPSLRIAELERLAVEAALDKHAGDRAAVAEELGVSVRTLYNKIKEFGL